MDQVLHLKKLYILRKEIIHHRGVKVIMVSNHNLLDYGTTEPLGRKKK